jgi:hypothetical protein
MQSFSYHIQPRITRDGFVPDTIIIPIDTVVLILTTKNLKIMKKPEIAARFALT